MTILKKRFDALENRVIIVGHNEGLSVRDLKFVKKNLCVCESGKFFCVTWFVNQE